MVEKEPVTMISSIKDAWILYQDGLGWKSGREHFSLTSVLGGYVYVATLSISALSVSDGRIYEDELERIWTDVFVA
jgi:hypothetical protein